MYADNKRHGFINTNFECKRQETNFPVKKNVPGAADNSENHADNLLVKEVTHDH